MQKAFEKGPKEHSLNKAERQSCGYKGIESGKAPAVLACHVAALITRNPEIFDRPWSNSEAMSDILLEFGDDVSHDSQTPECSSSSNYLNRQNLPRLPRLPRPDRLRLRHHRWLHHHLSSFLTCIVPSSLLP